MAELGVHSQIWEGGIVRMEVRGSVCAETTDQLEQEFSRWFAMESFSFAVGMQEVRELTSAGAATLIAMARIAQERGGRFVIVDPREPVKQALEHIGVLPLFEVLPSLSDLLDQPEEPEKKPRHSDELRESPMNVSEQSE